jgi:hypothetical protein
MMSPDPQTAELVAQQESKCLEIIRSHPNASMYRLMMLCMQAGFAMGANHFQSALVADLTIRGAKG